MKQVGGEVKTPDGNGTVMENNALKQTVKVKLALPDGTFDARVFSLDDVKFTRKKNNREKKEKDEPIPEELKDVID